MDSKEFLDFMTKVKVYDLTMPLSIHTPPWPSYMPLQIQYLEAVWAQTARLLKLATM
jgi:kynurenine formamidase